MVQYEQCRSYGQHHIGLIPHLTTIDADGRCAFVYLEQLSSSFALDWRNELIARQCFNNASTGKQDDETILRHESSPS